MQRLKTFVYTKEDLEAYRNGEPIDPRKTTQRSLARRVNVSQAFISQLASGKKTSRKPETAEWISGVLGVDVTVLYDPEKAITAGSA
ncbi:helix-turn-helix domain-containing protein [Glutamicibacter sp. AOP12-B1-11]|uniref:helix-turn-helix domain-containing protein n=1 Tax=Glutamicibacter sp. AOP12-B1-11 TaxID=3457725 RepID=UPI004033F479